MQVIEMIGDERRTLADVLVALTPKQLATPSLCGAWTVHDVAAHLLMPLVTGLPTVMLAMVISAGNFDKANRVLTARIASRSIAEIAQGLRDRAENPFSPPGMGLEAPLTDLLVHGQDIRRPLGLRRDIPADRAEVSLTFLSGKSPRGFVTKDRLAGLALSATDLPFSSGSGAPVTGPAEALLLALTGRPDALADLSGDGVALLRARISPAAQASGV
jgi:uncharacterized protein (TIGR03083 family)